MTRLAPLATLAAGAFVLHAPAPACADGFDPRDVDKQAHMATSYGITFTVTVIARRFEIPRWKALALGAATTAVLGTFKELVIDDPYAWGDQLANTIGSSLAAVVVLAFEI